jgi:uncharacterized integral membrane protein (TIGR00698 family)
MTYLAPPHDQPTPQPAIEVALPKEPYLDRLVILLPGIAIAIAMAVAAIAFEIVLHHMLSAAGATVPPVPAVPIALLIGLICNGMAGRPTFCPGLAFCSKTLLKAAIAMLGLRIALSDIAGIGLGLTVALTLAMFSTIAVALATARLVNCPAGGAALAGAANAICGASAVLATSAALPAWPNKKNEVVVAVVMANAVSTVAMFLYPALFHWGELGPRQSGIALGGSIQDVAQVVGAAYGMSLEASNTAVIVKMFRVLMLLPAVLAIGLWFRTTREITTGPSDKGVLPKIPVFAIAFLAFCVLNSAMELMPPVMPVYGSVRGFLNAVASYGMLMAVAALGTSTSFRMLRSIDWRWFTCFAAAALNMLVMSVGIATLFA